MRRNTETVSPALGVTATATDVIGWGGVGVRSVRGGRKRGVAVFRYSFAVKVSEGAEASESLQQVAGHAARAACATRQPI